MTAPPHLQRSGGFPAHVIVPRHRRRAADAHQVRHDPGRIGRFGAAGAYSYFFLPEASCSTTMSSTYTFDGASAGGFFQS